MRSSTSKALRILVTGLLSTGCGGYVRVPFDISAPVAFPAELPGQVGADGRTTLHLDGLELRIEARNHRATGAAVGFAPLMGVLPFPIVLPASETTSQSIRYPLLLFLEFAPVDSGLSFEPMAVSLSRVRGDPVFPRAFVGPGRTQGERCLDPKSKRDDLVKSVEKTSFPIHPGEASTCFALVFSGGFNPETNFRLHLAGLTRAGEPVAVPDLTYSKHRARSMGAPRTWRPRSLTP